MMRAASSFFPPLNNATVTFIYIPLCTLWISVAFCQMRKCSCLSQGAVVRIKWQDKCDCAQEAVKWQRIVGHLPWVELDSHTQARLSWLLWFEEERCPQGLTCWTLGSWLMVLFLEVGPSWGNRSLGGGVASTPGPLLSPVDCPPWSEHALSLHTSTANMISLTWARTNEPKGCGQPNRLKKTKKLLRA